MTRSTFIHLRIPFSYFLLPVFLLAVFFAHGIDWTNLLVAFAVLHLLLYPASNAFNSYYDRDTASIGCLRNPPTVEEALLPVSLALDALAVAAGFLVSWHFAVALLLYGLCSKLYSFDGVRLKRRPIVSWLGTSLVQGGFVFLVANSAVQAGGLFALPSRHLLLAAGVVTIFLMGCYPTTQIYQHAEDAKRGDRTMSMLLGIDGTFLLSGSTMLLAAVLLEALLCRSYGAGIQTLYVLLQLPAAAYFANWYRLCRSDPDKADYPHAMRFNALSASGLNLFCIAGLFLRNR
jgi:1,4-dihydroxy-2-naphthoate octaprenyltransferase